MKPNTHFNVQTQVKGLALSICSALLLPSVGYSAEKDTLNSADVSFIKHAAASGMAEVKIADLGMKKAERADVKAFAETVHSSHSKAQEEIVKLASTKGVDLSGVIDPERAETYQKLEKSRGAEFDRDYLAETINSHEKCISRFEESSKEAADNEVKVWASKMVPTLQAHLAKAKQLNSNSNGSATNEPTNTAVNVRDRDDRKMTPLDQGSSKSDVDITAQIRKQIIANKNMSVNAQNVKIITTNGQVTLRGPVDSAEEKKVIGEIVESVVHAKSVDNQLDVPGTPARN